ncbi:hypothetical protein GOV04_03505 [Candidatus Woesearchaeota archaeon]|nr:hypothetical protein [Candidatus Woesearchaeota archaeon]
MRLQILNSRQVKVIKKILTDQWSYDSKLNFVFLKSQKDKLYLINRDIEKINLKEFRVDNNGLYFGELRNDELRLSIEGSQIVGPYAKKKIVELTQEQIVDWFAGEDIKKDLNMQGFVLVKHRKDFCGTTKHKEGILLNFIPKSRRAKII